MRVAVDFQDERLELDVPDDRLIAAWQGPPGVSGAEAGRLVAEAMASPRGFPPLPQAIVGGDRVVIACDPQLPEGSGVLASLCRVLRESGGGDVDVTVLVAAGPGGEALGRGLPEGVAFRVHDPDDRNNLAYLSSTKSGRRVYLNRLLTDADMVIPVGRLGYDPVLGYRGPWSVLFPGMSDSETLHAYRAMASQEAPDRNQARPALAESAEVSWLLGSQFHVGILAGRAGLSGGVAGLEKEVLDAGCFEVDRAWSFEAPTRAELVIAGIGRPDAPTGIEDLAEGLIAASRLVQHGGKIVALSRAEGPIGPSLRSLIEAGDPRLGSSALRGREKDPDYPAARKLAEALAWADVYLLSALGTEVVEDLSMIALERPEEARRLAALGGSCLVVGHADLTRSSVADERE